MKTKVALLAALLIGVAAVPALAATVTGDGTLVGTTGNDTISAGAGNDTVWGLGGVDTISAKNGNDMIDANGHCSKGIAQGDYPHGFPPGQYCEHGQIAGSSDTISAGNGNDTVFGGGGKNTISVGAGDDTIYGGPIADTISAGLYSMGDDTIYLGKGPGYTGSKVSTGQGADVIHAQNGVKDTTSCQRGNETTVYADRGDSVSGCARVIYTADPNPISEPYPTRDRRSVRHATHKHKTRLHSKRSRH